MVTITGILNEINVEEREKDGRKYVTGNIKIQTDDNNVVPVNVFAFENTKKGTINPAYTQIKSVCDKGISMVVTNGDTSKATKVRSTGCRMEENMFVSRFNNNIVSSQRITGSFFTLNASDEPKATFSCGIYITNIKDEVDFNGDETNRLIIEGLIEQYNRWDSVKFIAESKQAVDYIRNNWESGDTVSINGKIITKVVTQKISNENEGGFGEPEEETRTYYRTEYIITSGSEPKEDEFAYNAEKVKEGMADRERRKVELVEGNKSKPVAAKFDDADF